MEAVALDDVGADAEEHGIRLRSVADAELGQAASLLAGEGSVYHVGANLVEGPEALTLVTLGRRWPAQIEPGWTAPVLALSGLDAVSMRVLRRAVSGQTQRNMLRDHFGGRRSQTDPMQTNRPLGPIAATSTYGPFGE